MPKIPATILGFDYGTKRIGVAVGQTITHTATPLTTLHHQQQQPDWREIKNLISVWKPQALVVGMPHYPDNNKHPLHDAIQHFCQTLIQLSGLPVHTIDERLSSYEAEQLILEKKHHTHAVDSVAAQIILETWLRKHDAHS